jgi:hypothetical protein
MPTISSGLTATLAGLTTTQTAFNGLPNAMTEDQLIDLQSVESITSQLEVLAVKYQGL